MTTFDKDYWEEFAINQKTILDLNERLCNTTSEREKTEPKHLLKTSIDSFWKVLEEIKSINISERPKQSTKEEHLNFLKTLAEHCQRYVDIEKKHLGVDGNEYGARVLQASAYKTLWIRTCLKEGQLNFSGQDMRRVNLSGLSMREVNFSGSNMCGANFSRSDLSEANFSKTNLTESNFEGAKLIYVNFEGAGLSKANLLNTALNGANFESANTNNAITDKSSLDTLFQPINKGREEYTFRDL